MMRATLPSAWKRFALLGALVAAGIAGLLAIPNAGADEPSADVPASADTYLRRGNPNTNEGASTFLRVRATGDNRALIRFDEAAIQDAIGAETLLTATLRLTIVETPSSWGPNGRTVDLHRMLQDWAEGNGFTSGALPGQRTRGEGAGATWNCAIDADIANFQPNCDGETAWEMNENQPNNPWDPTPSATTTIVNNQSGVVEFDVTADVMAFLSGEPANFGWLIRKTEENQSGNVTFGSREGGNTAPVLVLTFESAPPEPGDDEYDAIGNVLLAVDAANGILANDQGDGNEVTSFDSTSAQGGQVHVNPDGSFTYNPPAGFEGEDSFGYVVTGFGGSAAGTVVITVEEMVWFIDNSATGSAFDGRMTTPFNSLSQYNESDLPEADDFVFIYEGDGTTAGYDAGITLLDGQQLIGEGVELVVLGQTLVAAGSPPTITNTAGDVVALALDNRVAGLNVETAAGGTGLSGSAVGALTIHDVSVSGLGAAVNLASGELDVVFDSVSADGADVAVALADTTGSFTSNGGELANSVQHAVTLDNVTDFYLNGVTINGSGSHGITGTGVTNMALAGVTSSATGTAAEDDALYFATPDTDNLLGTLDIIDSSFTGYHDDAVNIVNVSGTLDALVSSSSFIDSAGDNGGIGVNVEAAGAAAINLTVEGGSVFSGHRIDGVNALSTGDTSALNLTVHDSTFEDGLTGGGGIIVNAFSDSDGSVEVDISNNTFTNLPGSAIQLLNDKDGELSGIVVGNTIEDVGGDGIRVRAEGGSGDEPLLTAVRIEGNAISGFGNDGIDIENRDLDPHTPVMQLAVIDNTIADPAAGAQDGIFVSARDDGLICLRMTGNDSAAGSGEGYFLAVEDVATFELEGFMGDGTDPAQVIAFIESNNTGSADVDILPGRSFSAGTCTTP